MDDIVSLLLRHAQLTPQKAAFGFCETTASDAMEIDFAELCSRVCSTAAALERLDLRGKPCLLVYPAGLEFVVAFLGCLAAGVVAVPVSQGRSNKSGGERLRAIVGDCGAAAILLPRQSPDAGWLGDLLAASATVVETADLAHLDAGGWVHRAPPSTGIAFLQYTSGSTGHPKGVMVTHGNLAANAEAVRAGFSIDSSSRLVCWLPHYHDLGLIGNILQAVVAGAYCLLVPPVSLARNPIGWLQVISRHRATVSMAPNFAFALCTARATSASLAGLDLGSLRTLINAAEPVRSETMAAFTERFAPFGFDRQAFRVAYGLAETTLLATSGFHRPEPVTRQVDRQALADGVIRFAEADSGARTIVSSGKPCGQMTVAIVDPTSREEQVEGRIGEIWLHGPSVCDGFWNRPVESSDVFGVATRDGRTGFLRTGDVGVLLDGELFVTGRLKELILVRGMNHYPQDIEHTAQQSCSAFRAAGSAAFLADDEGSDRLVVVQEVEHAAMRRPQLRRWASLLRARVLEDHGLAVADIVFVPAFSVPKTSSGKTQRRLCRDLVRDGQIKRIAVDRGADEAEPVRRWLQEFARRRLNFRLMDQRRSMSPHLVLEVGNRGLLGLERPVGEGGLALPLRDALSVIEQAAAIDLSLANFLTLQNALVIKAMSNAGAEGEALGRLASGRELGAFAMTEPGAGSNVRGIRTIAREIGPDRWSIDGEKIWIGNAGWAQTLLVFAMRVDRQGTPLGICCFRVPADAQGLQIDGEHLTMGLRSMVQNTVRLHGVEVGADQVLGPLDAGMEIAQGAMKHTRLYIAAGTVGGARRAVQMMVRYAGNRQMMAQSLIGIPAVARKISHAACLTESVATIVAAVADALEAEAQVADEIYAVAKVLGTETLWEVLDDLAQVLGGRGYIESNLVPQMIRDARVLRVFEGPTETLLTYVGAAMRSRPKPVLEFLAQDLGDTSSSESMAALLAGTEARFKTLPASRLGSAHLALGTVVAAELKLAALRAVDPSVLPLDSAKSIRRLLREAQAARAELSDWLDDAGTDAADSLARIVARYEDRLGVLHGPMQEEITEIDRLLSSPEVARAEASRQAAPAHVRTPATAAATSLQEAERHAGTIRAWMTRRFHDAPSSDHLSFADMGVDSLSAVELAFDLGQSTGIDLDTTILWVFPTIAKLSSHIAERTSANPGNPIDPDASSIAVPTPGNW